MMLALAVAGGSSDAIGHLVDPWAKLYSGSKLVSALVLFFHLVPLVIAAGTAFVSDRATIRASHSGLNDRARQLKEQLKTHRIVLIGLTMSFVSGVLLFLADIDTFLGSKWFYVKLGFVGLLLINGFIITRTERVLVRWGDKDTLWNRMRLLAYLSEGLWLSTILAGVLLASFA